MPKITDANRLFLPRGAAEQLLYCRDPEVLMVGPAGTGKSRACLEKVLLCANKFPGMRALLVRRTRASMTQSVLVTWEEKVVPPGDVLLQGPSRPLRTRYRLPNRSEIVAGGMDNADTIMSTEFDLVVAFEATELTEEHWEKLLSRLRNGRMPFQQAVADCNPAGPRHWLHQRAGRGLMRMLTSRHTDNPQLFTSEGKATPAGEKYMQMLNRLTGVRRLRLLEGAWAATEGLVYPDFSTAILPVTPPALPSPAVTVVGGIDWGWRDPFAAVVVALGRDRCAYVVDELHQRHLLAGNMVAALRALQKRWDIAAYYCDPSQPQSIRHLLAENIMARPHRKASILAGVAQVEQRIVAGLLRVYPSCKSVIEEASMYCFRQLADGSWSDQPADRYNHAMDALRYALAALENMPEQTMNISLDDEGLVRRLGHDLEAARQAAAARAEESMARDANGAIWGDE